MKERGMPVEIGTHLSGERYARAHISGDGFSVTVEGKGADDDQATMRLMWNIRKLGEMCEDIADEMMTPDDQN
jgi:hypothetical protein